MFSINDALTCATPFPPMFYQVLGLKISVFKTQEKKQRHNREFLKLGKTFPAQLQLEVWLPTGDSSASQFPNFLQNSDIIQSFPNVQSVTSSSTSTFPGFSLSLLPAWIPATGVAS